MPTDAAEAPVPALADVSFRVEGGQVLLVVGPSGSGKSTLARAVAGLIPGEIAGDWTGSLRVGDLEVATAPRSEAAARIGVVFQDPASQLVMERVGDDVAFGLENRAWPLVEMRRRVPEALAEAGLDALADRRSDRLSGGEQQRVALAGALAPRPGLLVLDEPTANLDPEGTAALYRQLARIRAERRATIVLVEHRADQAWQLADVVLALGQDGRPIASGRADVVLAKHAAAFDRAGVWLPNRQDHTDRTDRSRSSGARPGRSRDVRSETLAVGPAALELREAWFGYGRGEPVLHGVSLEVRSGEFVALVGPNGSGKSTLLRLALGLLRPRLGLVTVAGVDPRRLRAPQLAARVGYVPQDPEIGFIGDTVREEIEVGNVGSSLQAARELSTRLGLPLERFGDRSPYRLSGGEQRRLSIVTALARNPGLLLLDEPTFGQDRHGHEELVEILGELAVEGTAILAATHDDRFVEAFADRIVRLDEGWLTAERAA